MKRLIVGIDPGLTCGVAALTLGKIPVLVSSQRDWTLNELVKMLTGLGEPLIFSSDVSPPSELIARLSRNFDAIVFTPLIPLGAVEKQRLARDFAEIHGLKLRNAHETDALAAALKAYNYFKKKFEQIEVQVKDLGAEVGIDDVKSLVIKGYTIKRAINYVVANPETSIPPPILPRKIPREERLKNLVKELNERLILNREETRRLQSENRELRKQMRLLRREISASRQKIEEAKSEQVAQTRREREYQRLLEEIESLKRRLSESSTNLEEYKQRFDALQRLRDLQSLGVLTPLRPVENFTKNGLEKAFKLYQIRPGDYVLLMDASGGGPITARTLAEKGIKVIVSQTQMSHQAQEEFDKYDVPVIPAAGVRIEWVEGFPYINVLSLREALERLKESKIEESLNDVERIIQDHRRESRNGAHPTDQEPVAD